MTLGPSYPGIGRPMQGSGVFGLKSRTGAFIGTSWAASGATAEHHHRIENPIFPSLLG